MDAHLERSERYQRVSRDGREERQWLHLQIREGRAASPGQRDYRAVQDRQRHGEKKVYGIRDAAWADRARSRRKMGKRPVDAGARQSADAVLHAHKSEGLQIVPPND